MSKLAAAIVSYLQNWITPFLPNNKLLTNTDGQNRALVAAFHPRFQNFSRFPPCDIFAHSCLKARQYTTYLNATHETSFIFDCCTQFSIVFDCLSVRFPNVRELYLLLSTQRERESFQLCRILQMLSTAATIEVSECEWVFFAMLTCWHLQFSKILAFLFFSIN